MLKISAPFFVPISPSTPLVGVPPTSIVFATIISLNKISVLLKPPDEDTNGRLGVHSFSIFDFPLQNATFVKDSQKRKAMNNSETKPKKESKALRITTYTLVTLLFLFFSFALVPKIIDAVAEDGFSIFYSGGWEGLIMIWTYIVFLIGFAIVWKNKLIGGIIILLASILQMGPFLIMDLNFGSLIFGLPMLVSSVLFLILSKCQHKD